MYGILSILFFILGVILKDDKIRQVILFGVSGLFSIATCLSVIEDKITTFIKSLIENKIIITVKNKDKENEENNNSRKKHTL